MTTAKEGAAQGRKQPAKQAAGKPASPKPAQGALALSGAELIILNNALNQALELGESDYSTLIGGKKRAGERLLARLGAALSTTRQPTK